MGNEQAKVSNSLDFPRDLLGVVKSYDDPCDRLPGIDDTCWSKRAQKSIMILDPDSKRSIDCTQSCKQRNTKKANTRLLDIFGMLPLGYEFRLGLDRTIVHIVDLKPIKFDFVSNDQIMNPIDISYTHEVGYDKLNILYDLTNSVDYEYKDQKVGNSIQSLDRFVPVGQRVTLLNSEFYLEQSKPAPFGRRLRGQQLKSTFDMPSELRLYRPSKEMLLITFIP